MMASKKSKGYLGVCLNFGYVESASIASVLFRNLKEDFKTEHEAINSLAEDLRSIYHQRVVARKKKRACCEVAKGNFCSTCGKSLVNQPEIDVSHFKDWLVSLLSSTNDSFGYNDYADGREIHWQPECPSALFDFAKDKYKCAFVENAENAICEALGLEEEY